MCPGEALISPYINLPVAHSTDSAPFLCRYPWRTCLCRATPKYEQAGRPGPILAVAHLLEYCATAKLESVAQAQTVRHAYLAMADRKSVV